MNYNIDHNNNINNNDDNNSFAFLTVEMYKNQYFLKSRSKNLA